MKKKFVYPLVSLFAVAAAALLFLNFSKKENTETPQNSASKWTLQKVDDFKVMTVAPNGNWMTEIKKAMLSKRLNDGNLPVSIAMTVVGTETPAPIASMECRLQYDDMKIEGNLRDLQSSLDDSTSVSKGIFAFDFSKAENASIENLYHLSSLSSEHMKVWVKPHFKDGQTSEWYELECKH
ncbi:MAG: hypothetical protein J6Y37_11620 [Paludibacteraceae bacterium]|nr:hypothetical protein [Paludibacteraceae bacterium]